MLAFLRQKEEIKFGKFIVVMGYNDSNVFLSLHISNTFTTINYPSYKNPKTLFNCILKRKR